jgi:hypothetical protein
LRQLEQLRHSKHLRRVVAVAVVVAAPVIN